MLVVIWNFYPKAHTIVVVFARVTGLAVNYRLEGMITHLQHQVTKHCRNEKTNSLELLSRAKIGICQHGEAASGGVLYLRIH